MRSSSARRHSPTGRRRGGVAGASQSTRWTWPREQAPESCSIVAGTAVSRSCSPIRAGRSSSPRRGLLDDPQGRGRPGRGAAEPSPGGSSRRKPAIRPRRRPDRARQHRPEGRQGRARAGRLEGDLDPATAVSNTFEMSGRLAPAAAVVPGDRPRRVVRPAEARRQVKATQIPLIDRLEEALIGARARRST